ncbi:MAG: hypothetical protein CM15mV137_300 [uncultured marine virus]|nr:MAG: hypothetical protein CM15mV137_300 [uncultured marine virus]
MKKEKERKKHKFGSYKGKLMFWGEVTETGLEKIIKQMRSEQRVFGGVQSAEEMEYFWG